MIGFAIHGTKKGWRILHANTNNTNFKGFRDPAHDSPRAGALGNSLYGVSFSQQAIVYTKSIIVLDGGGDQRTGNLNFSIIIPWNKKMAGADIKALLDELHSQYTQQYMQASSFTLDPRMVEDWSFVDAIIARYNHKVMNDPDAEMGGEATENPAVAYYETDQDLYSLLSAPFQAAFKPYRQVYFVEKSRQGQPDNPLGALKHSPAADLSGKIQFFRPRIEYSTKIMQSSDDLQVDVYRYNQRIQQGLIISFGLNDDIKIVYSQANYKSREIKGTIKSNELKDFLIFDEGNKTFFVNRDIILDPIKIKKEESGTSVKPKTSSDVPASATTAVPQTNLKPYFLTGVVGVLLSVLIFYVATYVFSPDTGDNGIQSLLTQGEWKLEELEQKKDEHCTNVKASNYNQADCDLIIKAIEVRKQLNAGNLNTIIKVVSEKPEMEDFFPLKNLLNIIKAIPDTATGKKIGVYVAKENIIAMNMADVGNLIKDINTLLSVKKGMKNLKNADSIKAQKSMIAGINRPENLRKEVLQDLETELKKLEGKIEDPDGGGGPPPDPAVKTINCQQVEVDVWMLCKDGKFDKLNDVKDLKKCNKAIQVKDKVRKLKAEDVSNTNNFNELYRLINK
jgi:hypothetical protein